MKAKVLIYYEDKGFGWLNESVHVRRFFHVHNWLSDDYPQIGQSVSYDLAPGNPGKSEQAVNVRPIPPDETSDKKITATDALAEKNEPKESQ
jgi:cold shock CspA family protein